MTTTTMVAHLTVESQRLEDIEQSEAGPRSVTLRRPTGVGVRNDGYRGFWMLPGLTYRIQHDGTGFRVTCRDWTDGHVLRLVDALDGRTHVDALDTTDGALALNVGAAYEVREETPGVWALYAL
jgi:hypothetical protein